MIYLITGTPGTGKTALAVSMIINNKDGLFRMKLDDGTEVPRPLYFCHIDGLDADKLKAHSLTETELQSAPLRDLVPTGSVVIVDEADYTYPTRPSAREVPPYVKTLKELRHEGFTLILMTQHPSMIDSYLRNLVSKHWHLARKQVGTKLYEFNNCVTNLDSPSVNAGALSEFYKPDKKAFQYYKSASLHVKFSKRKHSIFYGVGLALLLSPFLLYWIYGRLSSLTSPKGFEQTHVAAASDASHAPLGSYPTPAPYEDKNLSVDDFKPTIANMPESRPLYNDIRQVKQFEYIAGCVQNGDSCTCYSQQATRLPIDSRFCRQYIEEGLPFNPFKEVPAGGLGASPGQPQNLTESLPEPQRIAAVTAMAQTPLVATLGTEPKTDLAKPPDINLAR